MIKLYYNEYVGMTDNGMILCDGNPNNGLSYHVCDICEFVTGRHPLPLVINKEAMRGICKKWNRETRGNSNVKCKPYKVRFSLEVIESSAKARGRK